MPPAVTLAERFAQLSGLDDLDRFVHPDDEMFAHLQAQVGTPRAELDYLRSGLTAFRCIQNVLRQCGRSDTECRRVLDFACGWGRLTRHLSRHLGGDRIWAADIAPSAAAFVGAQFGVHGVVSTRDPAELPALGTFDLIWVGSLFSHLPQRTFRSWLTRLWSMVADDGLLVFTTHGAHVTPARQRDPSGFTFVEVSETRGRLDTADYGTAYIDEGAMRALAGELGLPPLGWIETEMWGTQDVWVARRGAPVAPVFEPMPVAIGRIEKAWWPEPGHAWVGGGVRLPVGEGRPTIELLLDGRRVADCLVGDAHPHPHPGAITPAMQYFQFYTEGPVADRPSDVAAIATSAAGHRTVIDVTPL